MGESEASPPLSDIGGDKMTRTSSQTSGASTNSKKTYPARRTPKTVSKSPSISSLKRDPSLTSFPSLSPENVGSQQDLSKLPSPPQPSRTTSQKVRDRKRTLASLTSASGSFQGQSSLFDDSPRSSLDIPGALHLASDEHIERLIARSGAVKLVRQFAQDLALRDAELSSLRSRADDRERELKKMLREVEVSSVKIEKRLQSLENTSSPPGMATEARPGVARNVTTRIDNMVHQAMAEGVGLEDDHVATTAEVDPSATLRPTKSGDIASQNPATESSRSRSREGSGSGWQPWSVNAASPDASTASSVLEGDVNDSNATAKPRVPSSNTKRRGLDSLFQTPTQSSSYFIGGAHKTVKKPAGDDASVHSQKSNRSMGWTKIFAGTSLAVKDDAGRPRSSSLEQDKSGKLKTSAAAADSAILSRVRTNPAKAQNSSKPNVLASSNTLKVKATGRRTPTFGPPIAPEHVRRDSDATSLGPVEMDTILDAAAKPPTMTHAYNNYQSEGLLTDRFGFIYDQRQRKRQRQALAATKMNRLSGMSGMSGIESLSTFRTDSDSADESHMDLNSRLSPPIRPATPTSTEEESQPKKWSDYLKVPAKLSNIRPTELLSHTPSAGAVITVSTADASGTITPPKARETSISVKSQLALPITSFIPKPSQSSVTADSPTFANNQNYVVANSVDQEPVKLLLEQLTELHDTLQAEREAKFNDFLRKVRAERSTTASSDRVSNNVPEADIPNGELIGNLGHAKNRAKYLQFRALVLSGIPVSLRPRVWAECSGASTLRIPGYYEELVVKSQSDENMDPDIAQQIAADVPRTLTVCQTSFYIAPLCSRISADRQ
jgi:small G protein signaling modulator 3